MSDNTVVVDVIKQYLQRLLYGQFPTYLLSSPPKYLRRLIKNIGKLKVYSAIKGEPNHSVTESRIRINPIKDFFFDGSRTCILYITAIVYLVSPKT